jgi:glutamate dehydrogenase (NAD(P)+)
MKGSLEGFNMSNVEPFKICDELGPEMIVHVYDPLTGMKGVVVIDVVPGGGGIRMLPDITTREIARLARAMTYKFAVLNIPYGGAKAGIFHDPRSPDKDKIITAFGRAIAPLLKANLYGAGADMGTSDKDVLKIYEIAGLKEQGPSAALKMKDGMPLEEHFTGFGVATAAKTACEFADVPVEGATVAIEGFGKVGGGAAKYLREAGAKVVAISTIRGAIYNPQGLDVEELLKARKQYGDEIVLRYKNAKKIEKEELFLLPVDILVPGARPDVINESNVAKIKAKVISEGANIPITPKAQEFLFKKGVISAPDFIANSGGVISEVTDRQSGGTVTEGQIFKMVEEAITSTLKQVFSTSLKEKINPMTIAVRMAKERVMQRLEERRKES